MNAAQVYSARTVRIPCCRSDLVKSLSGQWPIFIFVLMFLVLPLSTIRGFFDPIFIVLGIFTLVIIGFIVASLVSERSGAGKHE